MKKDKIYVVEIKRKRKRLTEYRKRLKILISGKPRLVIRKSLKNVQAAIIEYSRKGDLVKLVSSSINLKKFGWDYNTGNIPAAYLAGFLLGKRAKSAELDEAVLDLGLQKSIKGSRIYAVLVGALDAGLKVPHSKDILPDKERIVGTHIAKYAEILKKDELLLRKQFSSYLKNNVLPQNIAKKFEEVKNNIDKNNIVNK